MDEDRTRTETRGKRNRGGGRGRLPQEKNDFALPQLSAASYDSQMQNSVLGYGYREDHFTRNQDRIQMILRPWKLNLNGYHLMDPDTDAELPTGHYGTYAVNNFWPKTHLFNWWVQMAQMRDDYNPSANTLYDTSWNTMRDHDELLVTAKQVGSVLWTILHSGGYNIALKECVTAGIGYRRRIQRCLVELNQVTHVEGLSRIIDYWRKVFMPYESGPVVVNLFMFDHLNTDHSSGYEGFSLGTPPDLTNSAHWLKLVQNLERAVEELNGLNMATANRNTDFLVWQYHANMVGMGKPKMQAMPADVDQQKWEEQFIRGVQVLRDNTGGRVLLSCYTQNDEVRAQNFMQKDLGMDEDDWKGLKAPYAFISESNDLGVTIASQWLYTMGIVCPGYDPDATYPLSNALFYTREDGMFEATYDFDISAAAGCQALIWKRPDLTVNENFPQFIFPEETEELWHIGMLYGARERAHVVVNDLAQGYSRFLHDIYGLPFQP